MRMVPILKSMVLGAADGGIDVVGNAAFPFVWPAMRKAIDPVLTKLREKLDDQNPLDEDNKEKALALFDQDVDLQALLEDRLQAVVSEVRSVVTELNEGQERLLQIAQGNSATIEKLAENLHVQTTTLFVKGVRIAAESKQELVELFEDRQKGQTVRMQKIRDELDRQVSRINVRCVELIRDGQLDRAEEELNEGLRLLQSRLEESPGDAHLEVQLGYMLKTSAQHFLETGEVERGNRFNEAALRLFRHIAYGISLDRKSVQDHVGAINGIGNINFSLGHYQTAIQNYTMATQIDPTYFYAWHDLFGAYLELGKREPPKLSTMRQALDMMRETGKGKPGLGEKSLQEFELRYLMMTPEYILNELIQMCISDFPSLTDLDRSEKLQGPDYSSDPLLSLAEAQEKADFPKNAIKTYEEILAAYERGTEKRPHLAAMAASKLGLLLGNELHYQVAGQRLKEALALQPDYPEAWYNLAGLHGYFSSTEEKVLCYLKGAIFSQAQGDMSFSAKCLSATACWLYDDDKQSLKSNLRGGVPRVLWALEDYNGLSEFCLSVIKEALMFGNLSEAGRWLTSALQYAKKSLNPKNEAVTNEYLGDYYEKYDKHEEAIQSYTQALGFYEELHMSGNAFLVKEKLKSLRENFEGKAD